MSSLEAGDQANETVATTPDSAHSSPLCPVCETLPDYIIFAAVESTEIPVLQYRLQKDRSWSQLREDWAGKCGLYKLVVYLERGLFDYETSILLGYDNRTCKRRLSDDKPRGSFSLACSFGESLAYRRCPTDNHPDSPIAPHVENRLVHQDPVSRYSISLMKHWINECATNHAECSQLQQSLPSRVLDLQGQQKVRLVNGAGQQEQYVALSHCWGRSPVFTTTKSTLTARKAGFYIDELPQTFRDAIVLTRKLGIRYLWIDSLCIIQDDLSDWEKEAAHMADVYTDAYVTISASSAPSDGDGFLQKRPSPYVPLALTRPNGEITMVQLLPEINFPKLPVWSTSDKEPLNSRAWTFQERYLSRRKLTFSKEELGFECQTLRMEEGSRFTTDAVQAFKVNKLLEMNDELPNRTYFQWRDAVSQYSQRALTKGTDKLPALAGLADVVAKRKKGRYCAGIWEDDMPFGLWWTASDHCSRPKEWRAPSWSWASLTGPVKHDLFAGIAVCAVKLEGVHFQDIHVRAPEQNPYGAVTEAWIKLAAPILPVVTSGVSISLLGEDKYTLKYHFDVAGEASMNTSGLPLLYDDESAPFLHPGKRAIFGLLVQEVEGPVAAFKRVGHFKVEIPSREIERILAAHPPSSITLV